MSTDVLTGHSGQLLGVVVKSALLYGSALFFLRLGERRTLAQLNVYDVIVGVAIGAIVGRTATASQSSWAIGAVALGTLILVHRLLSWLRFARGMQRLTDPAPQVLVVDGEVQSPSLLRSGITRSDLEAALREHGFLDLGDVRLALLEGAGNLTLVRRGEDGPLVADVIRTAQPPRRGSTSRS